MNGWQANRGASLSQLRGEVDRMMGDFFGGVAHAMPRTFANARVFPALNVWEDGEGLLAEAELPGVKSEELDISIVGNELTLSGRRPDAPVENASFHRRERGTGEFTRTVRLPYEVDANGVQATLVDGVLTLRLPKAASARPRKIPVNPGH